MLTRVASSGSDVASLTGSSRRPRALLTAAGHGAPRGAPVRLSVSRVRFNWAAAYLPHKR